MSLYTRLGLNFDTSKFGNASDLSSGASNTLNIISSTQGPLPSWQQQDISAGPVVRTNYFQNPTSEILSNMYISATNLFDAANTANDHTTATMTQNLMIEINSFKSHTDNISGVVAVSNNYFPSLQTAQSIGQMNMMTLARSDGVSNTSPMLGSFTSLFIQDELQANANVILYYANEYANSITTNTMGYHVSSLSPTEILNIENYISNTQNLLLTRRTEDWQFYQNSMNLSQDIGYMNQFNNMGGTMTYLVNNVVGTPRLINNLNGTA